MTHMSFVFGGSEEDAAANYTRSELGAVYTCLLAFLALSGSSRFLIVLFVLFNIASARLNGLLPPCCSEARKKSDMWSIVRGRRL